MKDFFQIEIWFFSPPNLAQISTEYIYKYLSKQIFKNIMVIPVIPPSSRFLISLHSAFIKHLQNAVEETVLRAKNVELNETLSFLNLKSDAFSAVKIFQRDVVHMCATKYYSAIKKNEILPCATTWIGRKGYYTK